MGVAAGVGDEAMDGMGLPGLPGAVTLGEAIGVDGGAGVSEGAGAGDADAGKTSPPGDRDGSAVAVVQAASTARAAMSTAPSRGRRRPPNLVRVVAEIRGGDRRQ